MSTHLLATAIIDLSLPPPLIIARVPKAYTKHATIHRRRYQTNTIPVFQLPRHKPPSWQNSKSNLSKEDDSKSNVKDDANIKFGFIDINVKSDPKDNNFESKLGIILLDLESNIDSGYSTDQELAMYY